MYLFLSYPYSHNSPGIQTDYTESDKEILFNTSLYLNRSKTSHNRKISTLSIFMCVRDIL